MVLVRWRVHGPTPQEGDLDLAVSYQGRKGKMWGEGLSQDRKKSTESVQGWTDRQIQAEALCCVRVSFDDRMLYPWDVGNQ